MSLNLQIPRGRGEAEVLLPFQAMILFGLAGLPSLPLPFFSYGFSKMDFLEKYSYTAAGFAGSGGSSGSGSLGERGEVPMVQKPGEHAGAKNALCHIVPRCTFFSSCCTVSGHKWDK